MGSAVQQRRGIAVAPEAVREQLQRLLASSFFSNSKRYPALLSHVVVETLEDRAGDLKERTLGVEVFHRPIDYDTNLDPVVRITAGEVRKRLAQYYCEPAHESELRIELPPGSYVPEFHPSVHQAAPVEEARVAPPAPVAPVPSLVASSVVPIAKSAKSRRRTPLVVAMSATVILIAAFCTFRYSSQSSVQEFWGPVLKSPPVLICIGQPDPFVQPPSIKDDSLVFRTLNLDRVAMGDVVTATRITTVLGKAGVAYTMQGAESTSFVEMRRGPVVLISGADNRWTLRITDPLRFHFVVEGNVLHIEDRQNPTRRDWTIDFAMPYSQLKKDYGLVGRFLDPTTGQYIVVAAGIGINGTISAGELLSEPAYLKALLSKLPDTTNNFEAVFSTQVIDGKSGPPTILAAHSWK